MKGSKWFLIVNPTAGGGKGLKHWKDIEGLLLKMGIEFGFSMSEQSGHAIELTRKAIRMGYRRLVAVGGDGTAHEVVNGIFLQKEVAPSEITFGMIPVGTGNDWIKTHEIPNNYKKAILLLKAQHTMLHDIGQIDYHDARGQPQVRFFLNVAGLGYDAFVTKASHERRRWMGNKLFYYCLILRCITQYQATEAKVTFDGETKEGLFYSTAVGICKYNGGGAQFVPHAIPNDGKFAFTLFEDIKGLEVLFNSRKFYDGSITEHPKCFTSQVEHIRVEADEKNPTYIEADGEFLGQTPIDIRMHKRALKVVIP